MSFLHSDLLSRPPFSEAERQLASGLAKHLPSGSRDADPAPFYAAWLLCRARQGASCLDLSAPPEWPAEWPEKPTFVTARQWAGMAAVSHPLVGGPDDYRPVIIDRNGLYLHRYRLMEQSLAEGLGKLTDIAEPAPGTAALLRELFARNAGIVPDLQKQAVYGALRRRFAVITGGPGTGKTTCVLNLLVALLSQNPRLSVALAAPTGKAAARLNESLTAGIEKLRAHLPAGIDPALPDRIPRNARTLHKLLGITPHTPEGNTRATDHLASADVVVVDEASMIPLPVMTILVRRLAPHARLVLLGDRDQLASVDLGSVLGDIIAAAERTPRSAAFASGLAALETGVAVREAVIPESVAPLQDVVHRLTHTYRFKDDEVVGRFCLALQENKPGDAVAALVHFGAMAPAPLHAGAPGGPTMNTLVATAVRTRFAGLSTATDPAEALATLHRFRILASHRTGPFGVTEINRLARIAAGYRPDDIFHGLPVIITVNTPELDLWNGDCGVLMENAGGILSAYFERTRPDASDTPLHRAVPIAKLPEWEPAYALSIHKSQGSEFDDVVIVIPPEDSPLLTRELIYTGASRARKSLVIHAGEALLLKVLSRTVARPSGLAARLSRPEVSGEKPPAAADAVSP